MSQAKFEDNGLSIAENDKVEVLDDTEEGELIIISNVVEVALHQVFRCRLVVCGGH